MARSVVKIVGMADRMIGTAKKTGKPYDLVNVAITFVNRFGKNDVACAMLDGSVVDQLQVQTGHMYDAVVNTYNNTTYVDLIDEVF